MDHQKLIRDVQELTDIELAILLCLVAGQHCIIETEEDALDNLQEELQLVRCGLKSKSFTEGFDQIASNVYGLSAAVIHCSQNTTLEDFSYGILVEGKPDAEDEIHDSIDVKVLSPLLLLNALQTAF